MSDAGGAKVGPAAKSVLNEFTGLFRKREEPKNISMTAAGKKIFRLVTNVFFFLLMILSFLHKSIVQMTQKLKQHLILHPVLPLNVQTFHMLH